MKKTFTLCAAMALCAAAHAETIELNATLGPSEVKWAYGGWAMEFNDDSNAYTICTLITDDAFTGESMNELVGTYTMENLEAYLSFITTPDFSIWVEFADATISVSGNEATGYNFDMEIIGSDANIYKINASLGLLEVTEEKDVDFGHDVSIKYYESDGDWYIKLKNDEYAMNLDIISPELDGVYSVLNFDPLYTFVDDLVNQESYLYIVDAEVNINTENGQTTISGWVVLETGVKLNIHAVYGDLVGLEQITTTTRMSQKVWNNGSIIIRTQSGDYGADGVIR